MSREMLVFVSLIVWLFSITGKDGLLTVRPWNQVVMNGNTVTFTCISDLSYPVWKAKKFDHPDMVWLVKHGCNNQQSRDYAVRKSRDHSSFTCNLIVKPTAPVFSDGLSTFFICEDYEDFSGQGSSEHITEEYDSAAWAILIVLKSPLKCETKEKELACTLQHSAYRNVTEMFQYLEIRLQVKNPMGAVVSSKTAGFMDNMTVVTAALDGGRSFPTINPYSCSASFKERCDDQYADDCVENINILQPSAVECDWATGTTPETTMATEKNMTNEKATVTATSNGTPNRRKRALKRIRAMKRQRTLKELQRKIASQSPLPDLEETASMLLRC